MVPAARAAGGAGEGRTVADPCGDVERRGGAGASRAQVEVLIMGRFRQHTRAGWLAAVIFACLLVTACTALLGKDDFEFSACVHDSDCPVDKACSAEHTCASADGQLCGASADG